MNEQQEQLAKILGNNQNNGAVPRFAMNNNPMQQMQMQQTRQSPYYIGNNNNNNMLLQNTPFDNYMGAYPQQQSQQQPQNYFLKSRPVSSKEEARVSQIDLDGSMWVFTDPTHKSIYTKQIQNDGSSAFKIYVQQEEEENIYGNDYVTKNDLAKTVEYIMSLIPAQQAVNAAPQTAPTEEPKNDKTASLNF